MKATASKSATTRQPAAAPAPARPSVARSVASAPAKSPAKKTVSPASADKPGAARPAKKAPAKVASTPVKSAKTAAAKPVSTKTAKVDPVALAPKAGGRPAGKPASSPQAAHPPKAGAVAAVPARLADKRASAPSVSPQSAAKTAKMPKDVGASPAVARVAPPPQRAASKSAGKSPVMPPAQVAVTPTHDPDAAKATFIPIIERVMTPPVTMPLQKDPKRANNWKTLPVEQLTDQDVLAMPDGEYMNDVQLAFFRRKLQQLKADMLANAGETTEHLREDTVVVPDPADRATIEEEHALELRTRDRERKLLKKIEQAIARIDSGDYGYCDETGEPIGVGRLMARPTASLSLEAQQRRELKQKMFGD